MVCLEQTYALIIAFPDSMPPLLCVAGAIAASPITALALLLVHVCATFTVMPCGRVMCCCHCTVM